MSRVAGDFFVLSYSYVQDRGEQVADDLVELRAVNLHWVPILVVQRTGFCKDRSSVTKISTMSSNPFS